MRHYHSILFILLAVMAGCGQQANSQPGAAAPGNDKGNGKAGVAKAVPATGLATWLARYDAAWKTAIDATKDPAARNVLSVQLHIPTPDEQKLLRELGGWGVDERVKLLQQLLTESKTRQDLPIEYACHAATQGDEEIRSRIWTELFQPQLGRQDLSATENEILLRGILQLELASRDKGLTKKLVELVLARQPKLPAERNPNPKNPDSLRDHIPVVEFAQVLIAAACQAPADEQDAIFELLTGGPIGEQANITVFQTDGSKEVRQRSFGELIKQTAERVAEGGLRRMPKQLPDEQLAKLRDGQTPLREVMQLLQFPGAVKQLTAEEVSQIVARLVAVKGDPQISANSVMSLIERLHLPLDLADRRKLIMDTRPPTDPRARFNRDTISDQYATMNHARELLGQTPSDEFVELFAEIAQEHPDLIRTIEEKAFANLDAVQAKELIRRLSPQVLAKDNRVLPSYAFLSNRLELPDRLKVHQFLLKQMAVISQEPQKPKAGFDHSLDPLGEYSRVIALSKDLEPQTIKDVLILTYDGPGFAGKLAPAIQKFGPGGLPDLLGQLPVEQRAPWVKRIIAELQPEMYKFDGKQVLNVACKLGKIWTPAEAQDLSPHIIACVAYEFGTDHPSMRDFVGDYILARPASERVDLLKLLAKVVFLERFHTKTYPQESSNSFQLVDRVVRDIPVKEVTPLTLLSLELRMKGTNYDGVTWHFLKKLFAQVPVSDRPQIGVWIDQQLQGQPSTPHLVQLANTFKSLPGSLDLKAQEKLFNSLIERSMAAANGETAQDEVKLDESHRMSVLSNAATYLPELITALPEAQTRPGMESLIDPLTKFARDKFVVQGRGSSHEKFEHFLPALADTPYPFAPEKMKRITAAYFTYAHDAHPVGVQKSERHSMSIRGTLPPGETKNWCDQLIAWQKEKRKYGDDVNPQDLARYLRFLSTHVPAAELAEFMNAIEVLLPLTAPANAPQNPRPRPGRNGGGFDNADLWWDIYRKFAAEMPAAVAEQRIKELAEQAKTADLALVPKYKQLIVELLKPIARDNPDKLAQLVAAHELDDQQKSQAFGNLAKSKDVGQVKALVLTQLKSVGELKPENLEKVAGLLRAADAGTRLQVLDELAKPGADPVLVTMAYLISRRGPEDRSALVALMRQPENVGLRGSFILTTPRGSNREYVSPWELMQEK